MVPEPITRARRQAGEPGRDLGHHVDRVRGDEQDRVRRRVEDAGDHVAEHRGVAAEEREPGLAGRCATPAAITTTPAPARSW